MGRPLALWLAGVFSGFLAVLLGAIAVIESGLFDATASSPHIPIVAVATHEAMARSVKLRARMAPLAGPPSVADARAGFADYEDSCAACHGGPGVPRSAFAEGMTPTPPYLLDAARRWTPRQLAWIVAQGVKMTGMPAWDKARSPAALRRLVAFLEILPYLSPAQYQAMRQARGGPGAPATPATLP